MVLLKRNTFSEMLKTHEENERARARERERDRFQNESFENKECEGEESGGSSDTISFETRYGLNVQKASNALVVVVVFE